MQLNPLGISFSIWQSAFSLLRFYFRRTLSYLAVVLHRRLGSNGVVYYASAILEAIGVRHAFSTRIGGISPPPFDSLNLGNPNGCAIQDDYDRIWANYALLLSSIGCPTDPPLRVHQVHGNEVIEIQAGLDFDTGCKADALVSGDSRRTLSIRTADCVPILLSSDDGRVVAAVHAGWRGIVAEIIPAAIKRLNAITSKPASTYRAAIGPCIGFEAFEVGSEVLAEFEKVFGSEAPVKSLAGGKGRVDLRAAARLQLLHCGLDERSVDSTDRCTVTHQDEFFSHRRDHGITGRMAAVIAPSASEHV
jgi:polyphenol oxidase